MGCQITVEMDGTAIQNITGFTCKRGKIYAEKEVTHPTRIVTSSVRVTGNPLMQQVSVKTASDIPKDKIFDCVNALRGISVKSPVKIGDIILADAAGTGVAIVATKNV